MMNNKETVFAAAEEVKPVMASESQDTSNGKQAAITSSQQGVQSSTKQETPTIDIRPKEEMSEVKASNDGGSEQVVLKKQDTKHARVKYLKRHIQEIVRRARPNVPVSAKGETKPKEDTLVENKIKCGVDAPTLKKMKCEEADDGLEKQEIKSEDDAPVKDQEKKYQEDVLVVVEEEINCEGGCGRE